jgi:hypothetical protein
LEKNLPAGRKKLIPVVHDPVNPFGELKMYVEMGHTFIGVGSTMKLKDSFLTLDLI